MTRPQIIRADTLDLQDKSSPNAQDHSQQPEHPAPLGVGPAAPHQQASLRHVQDERHDEEERLQNVWNTADAGQELSQDPGSDDDRTLVNSVINRKHMQQDEQAIRLNGGIADNDDSDMQDGDGDGDGDDDMDDDDDNMDRISSSPSIDDGGYSLPLQPPSWPQRIGSLTPESSPMRSAPASSSPFTTTPIHFPISVANARKTCDFPAVDSPTVSNFPYRSSPIPISLRHVHPNDSKSQEHHHGEYAGTGASDNTQGDSDSEFDVTMSPRSKQRHVVERRLRIMREDSHASLVSDLDEDQASNMLQPMSSPFKVYRDDPFIGPPPTSPPRTANGTPPPTLQHSDDDDGESWTTDSDADSWHEGMDHDDDASNDVSFSDDPRFIDSGWGGECLRETEDIDFEFVYALHTFVATVEGQANATKGDTMVLLDDSNSYWWLVRVVKDSSIGYLPAEHIETPTERLARLNKHRNIDLSATMLGDTAEKSKNPLKKAMRRRNAKTVQFGTPTYVEASDYDYSSDEGDGELFGGPEPKQVEQQQKQQEETEKVEAESQEDLKVQPLKLGGAKEAQTEGAVRASGEEVRAEEDVGDDVNRPLDPKVSRNGTLRNTDSFFKDENTETRKITLTPNLLRDDSSTSTTGSRERGPSLESLEKNGFADKVKDDKKKKEKKQGMLSGLFKRKDKKGKGQPESTESDMEKQSEEIDRHSPQSKPSDEIVSERPSAEQLAPQRQTSKGKLQKTLRNRDDSPQKTKGILKTESPAEATTQPATPPDAIVSQPSQISPTMRLVPTEQDDMGRPSVDETPTSRNPFSSNHPQNAPKPEKVKKAKKRVQLDDFDTDDEREDEDNDPFADPDAQTKTSQAEPSDATGRLSESPVHVSAADAQPSSKAQTRDVEREPDAQQPPGLTQDTSSQETSSPVSTPTPDDSPMKSIPENSTLVIPPSDSATSPTHLSPTSATNIHIPPPSRPAPTPSNKTDHEMQHSPPNSSESTQQLPPWSDAALRAYLDDTSDVRDLLLVVNDTTGVVPVGRDHPFMRKYLVEDSKTVQGMSTELDRLLNGLMEKRMKRNGSAASKASVARSGAGSSLR